MFFTTLVNRNLLRDPDASTFAEACLASGSVAFGGMEYGLVDDGLRTENNVKTVIYTKLLSIANKRQYRYKGDAMTRVYIPIFSSFDDETKAPVGLVRALIHWATYFKGILPKQIHCIDFVIGNEFDESYTYRVTPGAEPTPLGSGNLHDSAYNHFERYGTMEDVLTVNDGSIGGIPIDHKASIYNIHVYPSQIMYDENMTSMPLIITFAVVMVFVFTIVMFLVYDRCKYGPMLTNNNFSTLVYRRLTFCCFLL